MLDRKLSLPTVSGLRSYPSSIVAKKYLEIKNWDKVKEYAKEEDIYQTIREGTFNKYFRQTKYFLSSLNGDEINIVANGAEKDRLALLWLGFCLSFPLMGEFVTDVIQEKLICLDKKLTSFDYRAFLDNKGMEAPYIATLSDEMRNKSKSVFFYNMREAGFLNNSDEILPAMLSKEVLSVIKAEDRRFFPGEVKEW